MNRSAPVLRRSNGRTGHLFYDFRTVAILTLLWPGTATLRCVEDRDKEMAAEDVKLNVTAILSLKELEGVAIAA